MKYVILSFLIFLSLNCFSQENQSEIKLFEEAYARNIEPLAKIYVQPQTCDLEYLTKERQKYGPYQFKFKGELTEYFLENCKNRALFKACIEDNADMMVGTIFDSYTNDSEPNVLKVTLIGYPVKFINFRSLGESPVDYEMVRTVYPSAVGAYDKAQEELRITGKK